MEVNKELLKRTLKLIEANPEHWSQEIWHCGTTHCFAGFVECQLDEVDFETCYYDEVITHTREKAKKALGLSDYWANMLFDENNSLGAIEYLVELLTTHDVGTAIRIIKEQGLHTYYQSSHYFEYAKMIAPKMTDELREAIMVDTKFVYDNYEAIESLFGEGNHAS